MTCGIPTEVGPYPAKYYVVPAMPADQTAQELHAKQQEASRLSTALYTSLLSSLEPGGRHGNPNAGAHRGGGGNALPPSELSAQVSSVGSPVDAREVFAAAYERFRAEAAARRGASMVPDQPGVGGAGPTGTGTSSGSGNPEALRGLDENLVNKIMNEIVDNGEPITFDDIAGLADAKQTILELVCWPMKRPDLFTGLRRGPNGLLLFGPPGTGKTLIGKAIAHESGACFFSISSSSLTSKWIGEGEKLVRTLFAVAAYREPAVVFIDEIDSLLTARKADENEASRRIKTESLVQLDGTGTSGQGRLLCIGECLLYKYFVESRVT